MEHHVRLHVLSASVVLALGVTVSLITSTIVASRAYQSRPREAARNQQEITVKGSARLPVRSDLGIWRISVSGQGADITAAYAVLQTGTTRVQEFLKGQGFSESTIALSAIDTDEQHVRDKEGRAAPEVSGYTLSRTFTVTSAEVDRIAAAAGEVTQLLQEGVRVASQRPEYSYTRVGDLKIQIVGEASKDALARAAEIARNSNCGVGEVRQVQMGVIQITRPHSTEVSSYGRYDLDTIDKDVSVVVTATYGLTPR